MLNLYKSTLLLFTIFFSIFIINFYYTKYLYTNKKFNQKLLIKNYMGFIFIIFGLLKLYDLPKFSNIFSKYDIISKQFKYYAFIYPFIEIIIGFLMLKNIYIDKANCFVIILMIISLISVSLSIFNGLNLRCGCLGSFFHIPLSYITISENIIMLFMAINLLE